MEISSTKRAYINFLRGITIFLMLWGHCIQYTINEQSDFFIDKAFQFIYSFHMPLFMAISGFLFFFSAGKRQLNDLMKRKTRTLLQPIFMCGIINYFLTTGIVSIIRGEFTKLFDGQWMNQIRVLWFLWSVLAFSIVVGIAVKITEKRVIRMLLLIAGWGAVALFPEARMNVFLYPFFVLGYALARYGIKGKLRFAISGCSLIIFICLLCFYDKKYLIYTSGLLGNGYNFIEHLYINGYRWIIGCVGCIAIAEISYFVFLLLQKRNLTIKISKAFEKLGQFSLEIYTLSISFLSYYLPVISKKIIVEVCKFNYSDNVILYDFVITPILAVLYSVLLFYIIKKLYKLNLARYIFGIERNAAK